ncbi:TIGR03620 family F420-dependent LLM class oxidoreductase [Dactylosporangium sp. CS-033363]|uniref:TIGR03620 family F420-dependent LLM class oxidoreductase n=1 Tax=Dactylosporangium sp. CS-033363 TaxID=3239935 RepID=UPI003D937278
MELGAFGMWVNHRSTPVEDLVASARLAEELGFGTFWCSGSPEPEQLRPVLDATTTVVVAAAMVNMWSSDPADVARQAAALEREHPGRVLIGVGAGHPEGDADYSRPFEHLTGFLDGLDAAAEPLPADRRVLGALRPRTLRLAGERSRGTVPYFTVPAHTRFARERLGQGPIVAPGVSFVLDADPQRARETAREFVHWYLGLANYTGNLKAFGYTDGDFAGRGSDRLVDAVVPHGSAAQVAAGAREHLDAGATHVGLELVGGGGRAAWAALADALGLRVPARGASR